MADTAMPRFIPGARSKTHKGFVERWGDTRITTSAATTTTFRDPNLVYVPYQPVREGLSFWHKSVIILVCIRHEDEKVREALESRVQEDIASYYGSLVPGINWIVVGQSIGARLFGAKSAKNPHAPVLYRLDRGPPMAPTDYFHSLQWQTFR
jgi:hypothetical protein